MPDVRILLCDDAELAQLRRRLSVRHACPRCGSETHGRPLAADGHISISHAPGLHAVALSAEPVGIDAEALGSGGGIEDVALHRAERAALGAMRGDERTRAVLEVWVAKEAALKLVGTGLTTPPESFVARHADGWGIPAGVLGDRPVTFTRVPVPGYVVMLASHRPVRLSGIPRMDR
ncbi:4'-phosphopantetheinyl transferase family protein [Cumulibacter manganitolerans]|uniref:4'-phosphopantetheinyl transferase family protein n=1 Tax=Cumulibacter manganitolerans TaxID=1884992 RepID=UPI001885DEFE|nr:4'-phosphopantetheinyl transferase superfamily protein [Cumulibacter manganitolerans]